MRIIYILIAILTASAAAAAQSAPEETASGRGMTLEACLDSALARNPALNAAALEVERAGIMRGTAFDPPFTGVTLKQETTGGGGPENGVAFSQDFAFPTLYVARHRQLDALYSLERSRYDVQYALLEAEVSEAYYEALHARELLRLNSALEGIYTEFGRVAAVRLEQGEGSRLECMNAERMLETCRLERSDLETRFGNVLAQLRLLTGCSLLELPADIEYGPIEYSGEALDFAATPAGRAADGEIDVARHDVAVARQGFLPEIKLGATVQALIKSFNPYHVERLPFEKGNFMGFEVGIAVPLFFGAQSARLKAARAQHAAATLRSGYAGSQAEAEWEALRGQLGRIGERLDYSRGRGLPMADEMIRLAEVSYRLGDIPYTEYIANMEAAYGLYRDYADAVGEYNQTVIKLNKLTGRR